VEVGVYFGSTGDMAVAEVRSGRTCELSDVAEGTLPSC
jgi:hypothetical protein